MKRTLALAVALLGSFAALAQAPAPSSATANAPKAEREHKVKIKQHDAEGDDDRDGDKAGKPANHGQNVSTFTKTTSLTGADKGAAVSTVARSGRGIDHATRSARGEHSHASGHLGGGHVANSHAGTHAHGH
ncbi:hypothetical protein [Hymenobacter rubidus]|uniref:hypothetical protein n=1 Tax=Hymenobacter rubidus TaxID=1441626 RepID=UPI00191C9147|nr:hypothetical protein [Hymenobacter rubidus]